MTTTEFTSTALLRAADELAPLVAAARERIELERRLPDELVERLRAAGFFRMPMPAERGGPELDPLAQLAVVERLSTLDAAVGWCVMIGSDGGFYSANLDDAVARELWPDLDRITAGWLFPVGRATAVEGGFRLTGRWSFGSTVLHADVVVGGCVVMDGAVPRIGPDGLPDMRVAVLPRDRVEVLDTWHTTGLAGSGSNDYAVDDVFVPEEHTWTVGAPPRRREPLYAFPWMFFGNIAGVPLGAARAAIDSLVATAEHKVLMPAGVRMCDDARVQTAVAQAETLLGSARSWVFDTLGDLWATLLAGDEPSPRQRALFRLSTMQAFQAAKQVCALAYETVGTEAIYKPHVLDRAYRDVVTMTQHFLGSTKTLQPAGALLLGLETTAPAF